MKDEEAASGSLQRAFAIIRALADTQAKGGRVTHIAKATGLTQATTHRLLQSLVASTTSGVSSMRRKRAVAGDILGSTDTLVRP